MTVHIPLNLQDLSLDFQFLEYFLLNGQRTYVALKESVAEDAARCATYPGTAHSLVTSEIGVYADFRLVIIEIKSINVRKIFEILHVYVPEDRRNLGIANSFMLRIASFCDKNNLDIRATCNYVRNTFFARHPNLAVGSVEHLSGLGIEIIRHKTLLVKKTKSDMLRTMKRMLRLESKISSHTYSKEACLEILSFYFASEGMH